MQPGALKALEFDRIVDAVCRLAQTPPGAQTLARMHPSDDAGAVGSALETTAETARFLSGTGDIVLRAPGGTEQLQILEVRYQPIPVEPFREPAGAEAAPQARPRTVG